MSFLRTCKQNLQSKSQQILFGCGLAALLLFTPQIALGVTSAEKQAEADAVVVKIDELETSLKFAENELMQAEADYETAVQKRDKAQADIKTESARIDKLQSELTTSLVTTYKSGGRVSMLDVMLDSRSFDEFLKSLDAYDAISQHESALIAQSKDAKASFEEAKAQYEEQGKVAQEKIVTTEKAKQQIESDKQELSVQLERLNREVVLLQAKEELERDSVGTADVDASEYAAAAAEAARSLRDTRLFAESYSNQVLSTTPEEDRYPASDTTLFANPCPDGVATSGFGWRSFNGGSYHQGFDLGAAEGTPYYAAEAGVVVYTTNDGGYNGGAGNWIVIAHGNGLVTKYMHSSKVYVEPGDFVERGQRIGAVGNTGHSFGAHLHFQVEYHGVAVDPLPLIS